MHADGPVIVLCALYGILFNRLHEHVLLQEQVNKLSIRVMLSCWEPTVEI